MQPPIPSKVMHRMTVISSNAFPAAFVALVIIASIAYPHFRTLDNLRNILVFASIPLIVALGQTIVIIGRGIDLSVGSMMALSGAVFSVLFMNQGVPMGLAFLICVVLGAAVGGSFNGFIITKLRVYMLIVTLGSFAIFRSQANVVLHGVTITIYSDTLEWLVHGEIGPLPVVLSLAAVLCAIVWVVLRATTFGRMLYAVGSNPTAARLAGIPVDRVLIIAYGLCAALAAIAGVLAVGQLGSAQPTIGVGTELLSISAVILGGTRLSGGWGGAGGTLIGVLFLGTLTNVLVLTGASSYWQGTMSGLVLVVAVALDRTRRD